MSWYRVARLVQRLSDAFCRHPQGIVCRHRQYEYDLRLRGYSEGLRMGRQNTEAKWRGSITGVGPYADYPAPSEEAERVAREAEARSTPAEPFDEAQVWADMAAQRGDPELGTPIAKHGEWPGESRPIDKARERHILGLSDTPAEALDLLPADRRDPDLDFALRTYGDGIEEIGMRPIKEDRELNDDELRAAAFLAANVIGHVYGFNPLARLSPHNGEASDE